MRALPVVLVLVLLLAASAPAEAAAPAPAISAGSAKPARDAEPAPPERAAREAPSRESVRAAERMRADAAPSLASAGTGTLAGTLTLGGSPVADRFVTFENFATGEVIDVLTDEDGEFAEAFPAGRWYAWTDAVEGDLELEWPARAKVTSGKTSMVTLEAVSPLAGIAFSWTDTEEDGFTAQLFPAGDELEGAPVFTCDVDIHAAEMSCDGDAIGTTLLFDLGELDMGTNGFDVLITPEDSDPFVLYDVWTGHWWVHPLTIHFEDTLAEVTILLGTAANGRIDEGSWFGYMFDVFSGKTLVGTCYTSFVEGMIDRQDCYGSGFRYVDDGEGRTFLMPAGTYSLTLRAHGAKEIVVKKLALTAGSSKQVAAPFVGNTVTVTVSGAGAAGSWALLSVYTPQNHVHMIWGAAVERGVVSFKWVPVGLVVVEVMNDERGTYVDQEKAFSGGTLKLKATLK